MALTNLAAVRLIPGMAGVSDAFLNSLITSADQVIKTYCKQALEQATYTEYYSGNGQPDLVLKQMPVQSIQALYVDPRGAWGQAPNSFGSGTLQTLGTQYALVLDSGGVVSNRGLVRRISGYGYGFGGFGWGPATANFNSKLAATQLPAWPVGYGNVKIQYTAGYAVVPADLAFAASELVAWAVLQVPMGGILSGESLGAYSWQAMQQGMYGQLPALMGVNSALNHYRDSAV